jgi:hypothetical protein
VSRRGDALIRAVRGIFQAVGNVDVVAMPGLAIWRAERQA